jgi:NAD(P)-dependent dehydrogenase (short-subunit alcohol dehydrogenase family)
MIRVVVTGAYGKMGREVVKTVLRTEDMELVGAVDSAGEGTDVGTLVEAGNTGVVIEKDLAEVLARVRPDVAVDFTNPHCVFSNALIYLQHGVRPVIGTTGLSPEQIDEIIETSSKHKVGGLIAPNVAIGALLMMKFAAVLMTLINENKKNSMPKHRVRSLYGKFTIVLLASSPNRYRRFPQLMFLNTSPGIDNSLHIWLYDSQKEGNGGQRLHTDAA